MTTAPARIDDLAADRLALLKRTLCPDLTDDEMELLAGVARRTGLDPFARQIYGIKRKGKLCIQTGIDGLRAVAARTGELDGQGGPYWCGPDGVWRDVWLDKAPPAAAKVVVYRKGCRRGFAGVARYGEYATGYDFWQRMPAAQLAKCAEALALRKAFPADLSGLYADAEMEQADGPEPPRAEVKPLPPAPVLAGGIPCALLTSDADVHKLAVRKGWDWVRIVRTLNEKYGTDYGCTRTRWADVAERHRIGVLNALWAMPDAEPKPSPKLGDGNTASDLSALIGRVADVRQSSPMDVWHRVRDHLSFPDVASYDDLTQSQLTKACDRLRATLAQPKN